MLIVQDMIKTFKDSSLLVKEIKIIAINCRGEEEVADDFGGVFRDLLSSFWSEFLKGHAVGETEMVPCIRHDTSSDDWKAVCHILKKGYSTVKYFPIKLSKSFVKAAFFGEKSVNEDDLINSFFNYLPVGDADTLRKSLEKEVIDLMGEDEDLMDVLSSLASKRIVKTNVALKALVLELAHKEIIQTPAYIREAWEAVHLYCNIFADFTELESVYEKLIPSAKKVCKILSADIKNENERESMAHLRKSIRSMSNEDLMKFLRFTTGADVLCVDKIDVTFSSLTGLQRRIIAHTCGPVLEVPSTYECFAEFKGELLNLIQSGYWSMDFA